MTTITDPFEIIAAFVDGERVDAARLKDVLAAPDARDYLVELAALREIVGHEPVANVAPPARPSNRWLLAAVAAMLLSVAGGYTLGQRRPPVEGATIGSRSSPASDAAPVPTRVIQVPPGSALVTKGGH